MADQEAHLVAGEAARLGRLVRLERVGQFKIQESLFRDQHLPNPYAVTVTSVTGNGTITADSGHSTCGSDGSHPTGVTYTNQTGLSINVPDPNNAAGCSTYFPHVVFADAQLLGP